MAKLGTRISLQRHAFHTMKKKLLSLFILSISLSTVHGSLTCSAGEHGSRIRTAGTCGTYIDQESSCKSAADELIYGGGLDPIYDGSVISNTKPRGCILYHGRYYFNKNTNATVDCGAYDGIHSNYCVCDETVCNKCLPGFYSTGGKDATCTKCQTAKPFTGDDGRLAGATSSTSCSSRGNKCGAGQGVTTVFFTNYRREKPYKTCSSPLYEHILDEDACKAVAAMDLASDGYDGTVNGGAYPSGCFHYRSGGSHEYKFNQNRDGQACDGEWAPYQGCLCVYRGACQDCPEGFYSRGGWAAKCLECPRDKPFTLGRGATNCTLLPCDPGYGLPQNFDRFSKCTVCAQGYYSPVGRGPCSKCPLEKPFTKNGTFDGKGATSISKCYMPTCDPGFGVPLDRSALCTICSQGYFSPGGYGANCTKCPDSAIYTLSDDNRTFIDGATSIDSCRDGGPTCEPGEGGRATIPNSNTQILQSCKLCNRGLYGPGGKDQPCLACHPGRYLNRTGMTSVDDCKKCPSGKYSDYGFAECKLCDYGWVGTLSQKSHCDKCEAGTYMDQKGVYDGVGNCKQCIPGKYSTRMSRFCTPCEAGRYHPDAKAGKDGCKLCDAGKSTNNKVGQTSEADCIACPAGQYSDASGSGSCKECASGYFNSGEENTGCAKCPTNKPYTTLRDGRTTGASSMDMCTANLTCPAGRGGYPFRTRTSGQCESTIDCDACTEISNNDPLGGGMSRCVSNCVNDDYPPGCSYYKQSKTSNSYRCERVKSESKKQCGKGDYNGRICICDQNKCDTCPEGTSSAGYVGANVRCSLCPRGQYNDEEGGQCKICPLGRVTETPGQASCSVCQIASSSNINLTACIVCKEGYFCPGGSAQFACPAGTYNDLNNQSDANSCRHCEPGKFNDLRHQKECKTCAAGKESVSGAIECCVPNELDGVFCKTPKANVVLMKQNLTIAGVVEAQVLGEKAKIAAAFARCLGVGAANIELMSATQTRTETTVVAYALQAWTGDKAALQIMNSELFRSCVGVETGAVAGISAKNMMVTASAAYVDKKTSPSFATTTEAYVTKPPTTSPSFATTTEAYVTKPPSIESTTAAASQNGKVVVQQAFQVQGLTKQQIESTKTNIEKALAKSLGVVSSSVTIIDIVEIQLRRRTLLESKHIQIVYNVAVNDVDEAENVESAMGAADFKSTLSRNLKAESSTLRTLTVEKVEQPRRQEKGSSDSQSDADNADGRTVNAKPPGNKSPPWTVIAVLITVVVVFGCLAMASKWYCVNNKKSAETKQFQNSTSKNSWDMGSIEMQRSPLQNVPQPRRAQQPTRTSVKKEGEAAWREYYDKNSGRYYYYNAKSGTTQWEKPTGVAFESHLESRI